MEEENKVLVNVEIENISESLDKANKLVELLKEAKTLADELASINFNIKI